MSERERQRERERESERERERERAANGKMKKVGQVIAKLHAAGGGRERKGKCVCV